jgi:hypothetical protein
MTDTFTSGGLQLQVSIETNRAVELVDLGRSLQAFGKEYEEYVANHAIDLEPIKARLYVTQLRSGSIVATLHSIWDQASFIVEHLDVFVGFMANLVDLIEFFRVADKPAPREFSRNEAERLSEILEPVAKDSKGVIKIEVVNNTAPVTISAIVVPSEVANAIQNNVRRFVGPALPTHGNFEREVLTLHQMRGDPRSRVGDRGVIEHFSPKPVKLHFMTPDVKAAILDQPQNPFKMAYIVDGQVSTAKGEPALYKVSAVHDVLDRD